MRDISAIFWKAKQKSAGMFREIILFRKRTFFDPVFYYNHYRDLGEIRSQKRLKAHYANHGKREGRFPNEFLYIEHKKREIISSPDKFDIIAYKFYNRDLLEHFTSDEQFLEHYVRHGIHEGRVCRFTEAGMFSEDLHDPRRKWKSIFSPSEVIAWSSGLSSSAAPKTRLDAIDRFLKEGVDALWPISFRYRFDPTFYRQVYSSKATVGQDDAQLYMSWLEEGFPAGKAPNEELHLYSLMGGAPYPPSFDWQGYAARARLGRHADRLTAIAHLFKQGSANIEKYAAFLGEDAQTLLGHIGRHLLVNRRFHNAIKVFKAALALGPSADLYLLLGDAHAAICERQQALNAYLASIEYRCSQIWPYLHAIDLYCGARDFPAAFSLLRQSFERWQHRSEYQRAMESCIDRYFEHHSALAHQSLRCNVRHDNASIAEVDMVNAVANTQAALWQALDEIQQLYLDLDMLPAPVGGDPDGYVLMLANDDLRQCTYYRIEQKRYQFEAAGIALKIVSHHNVQDFLDNLVGARSVIFYRVAATPRIVQAILHAKHMGLRTYYEIDDLIFDEAHYPDSYESYEGQISPEDYAGLRFGVPLFRYAMAMCDAGISSTPALAKKIREVTRTNDCLVVRNALDCRNAAAIQLGASARPANGKVRIFYGSGTKAHNADFNDLVGPALIDIMRRNANVELVIVGYLSLRKEFKPFEGRIRNYPFVSDLNAYWSLLATCHINLAVLHPSLMTDCKSEIKWLEAAVLQIPSIVSDTATYRETIDDGADGFIAATTEEWSARLRALIESTPLRENIGAHARAKALKAYDLAEATKVWKRVFGGWQMVRQAVRKPRVLVCNVFFHPQSIGGATRVVEDNVGFFIDNVCDVDLAVCCSDEGRSPAGRLRMTSFRGVPVYRISTPVEQNMDWRPFNVDNATLFEAVLDHFKPDIVHFHCIQRLTASIVEVALKRHIPYIVTLHDGWWISDNQFLVDRDGFLKLPSRDILDDYRDCEAALTSIERRQRLGSLLQAAAIRLSVSEPFARLHENAGLTDVRVIENGVSILPSQNKHRRMDGRVRLGHIGGRAAHKGAFLIEAALRQGCYRNLHLTMIDGQLGPEQVVETMWGTTPVTLTGPYPQARVGDLYAGIDVLLAPSTWPESFGLVTREAMSQGCWVVASNLGAVAQGIREGVNGHVIDPSDSRDLKRIFGEIDEHVERYQQSPAHPGQALRTTAEQGRELHTLYRELLGL